MKRKAVLCPRDREILSDVQHGPHTTSQIAERYFPSKKKAAESMNLLFRSGLVKRFPKPILDGKGKVEFVYCHKGYSSRGYAHISHSLAVTEFKVRLLSSLKSSEFTGQYFYPSQLPQKPLDGRLIPDGIFTVEKQSKALLFFLEIDLGTESLDGKNYGLRDKLRMYADYFDNRGYIEDLAPIGRFKGFRVAIVFDSVQRLENFMSVAAGENADFVLLSTRERLRNSQIQDPVWMQSDGVTVNLFGKPGDLEGDLGRPDIPDLNFPSC